MWSDFHHDTSAASYALSCAKGTESASSLWHTGATARGIISRMKITLLALMLVAFAVPRALAEDAQALQLRSKSAISWHCTNKA